MACSATSPDFYLPPRYETLTLDVNISFTMANLLHDKHFGTGFLHMETSVNQQE